jgi:polar amino acid transport system substrate-binding protein
MIETKFGLIPNRRIRDMKRLVAFIIAGVLLIGFLLPACSSAPATPSDSMKIQVATDATWRPFEYIDDQKQIVGMDIDIMNAIAAKENLVIDWVDVRWDALLAGMAQSQYDAAISSITITEERKQSILFSEPYFAAGQLVVVRKDNTTIKSKNDLTGPVGVQLGTTGDIEVQKIAAAKSVPYQDINLAFLDLMNGQVNAVVCDNPVALLYVGQNDDKLKSVGTVFTSEFYGIAISKNKAGLESRINAGIAAVKKDGIIDNIAKKWLEE